MDDALRGLLLLQCLNTAALIGIAFAAGKYAQSVTTLEREVSALRDFRHDWGNKLVAFEQELKDLSSQIGGRRTGDSG